MNAKQIIIAVATAVAASSSFAVELSDFSDHKYASNKTRAEVIAELKQVQPARQVVNSAETAYPMYATNSMKSRDEVRKEATQTAKRGRDLGFEVAM